MTQDWTVPAWGVFAVLGVVLLLVGVLAGLSAAARRRGRAALATVAAENAALRAQVEAIARRLDAAEQTTAAPAPEFVITDIGRGAVPEPEEQAPALPAPLFADLVLRESVVQAASLAQGLRRALSPETRHRIRFQMRQEVKRSRRQRRAELRAARRLLAARDRAALGDEPTDATARAAS
ncbi:hypothetical protein [Nocardioides ferulae]|uniref:hypothetical protein n=1 Tax=Nocardioides ferulae TaxID=2340821 RepID=UPI000EAB55F9|nr:hypothetical protein [Nocardioides ferulae]